MEYDLYTTHFGAFANDEIERHLFGSVDVRGAKAVRAFASGDLSSMHHSFEDFFEYLDAQRLRTPKGLDWIRSQYPALTQHTLMREMQALRFIHCTMWTEGVREIVSAKDSDVKFIVSDHPVTIYNAIAAPGGPECAYPADPGLELLGSQTIFALDANTCLILTHLEYAQDPKGARLTKPRTYARYRGPGLVRTDAFIRSRALQREEVTAVNHLLKTRARRYVAAAREEWLYPEASFVGSWDVIAQILLPRSDLWQFGGEIYVGYKDGSTHYQDAFGRTSGSHEYLKRMEGYAPGPNDGCGCGSGHKFKRCCSPLAEKDRPSWEVFGIRERNLMFCHRVQAILGLLDGKTWDDVRRELNDDHVKQIYEALASLWPKDTDLSALVPRPNSATFRAVYLGAPDARTIELSVVGWLAYFDEIVIAHPFINPVRLKPEFSPVNSPSKHRAQTLKNILTLLLLEPYIDMGVLHLIPDPGDFNGAFGTTTMNMATERTEGWRPDERSRRQIRRLAQIDHRRFLNRLPESSLRRYLRENLKAATDEEVAALVTHMKEELAQDPCALLQPVEVGEENAQFQIMKGYSLEAAMYLATLTGSILYTDLHAHWQLLHSGGATAAESGWQPLVEAWQTIPFVIEVDAAVPLSLRQSGKFGDVRAAIRRIGQAVGKPLDGVQPEEITSQLLRTMRVIEEEWARPIDRLRLKGRMTASIPQGGFERAEVRRLLLTFARGNLSRAVPMALFVEVQRQRER